MSKLILTCELCPGDIVMLTAAVRDLHLNYPGWFQTDVRTTCPELWAHNPYLESIADDDPDAEVIACEYPLIHQSNTAPYHFIHGYSQFLGERLGLEIRPTAFKGDVHLSAEEKGWLSQVGEHFAGELPFWIVVAGGKWDYTTKWWARERYQQVIDHFRGRLLFVQVGAREDHHPALRGVLDLRGRTDLRQLVRLVYHSRGVLCPVTSLMHLAAAVETPPGRPRLRPCIVVAGGREPPHWEAYSHHHFLHTLGALPCCESGPCWRSRLEPVGDGSEHDGPEWRCLDVRPGPLARCMELIEAQDVIRVLETCLTSGRHGVLDPEQARQVDAYLATRDR